MIFIVTITALIIIPLGYAEGEDAEIDCREVGSTGTNGSAEKLVISGDYGFIANLGSGLCIIDISNRSYPVVVGNFDTDRYTYDVFVQGDYAYLADEQNGLVIVNITNKSNPTFTGRYDSPGSTIGVTISGDLAFLVEGGHGLTIVDVSNKSDPKFVGKKDTDSDARDIVVRGNYAYIADGGDGLIIMDISNPSDPEIIGGYQTEESAMGIAIMDQYAFLAAKEAGLVIVNITNKTDPEKIGEYDTAGTSWDVAVYENHAYVADRLKGMVVIDISNLSNPRRIGKYGGASIYDVVTDGRYAYMARSSSGLYIAENAPIAVIDRITPRWADLGDEVSFTGTATDDGTIVEYQWRSDMIGLLSSEEDFERKFDVSGRHMIFFKVKDNHELWSEEDFMAIWINAIPVAIIESISPDPALTGEMIFFHGNGTDDGEITQYAWSSSIDSEFYNGTKEIINSSSLSKGSHVISLKVLDDQGTWSEVVNTTLVIHEKPEARILALNPEPAVEGESVFFMGEGIDDNGIEGYLWYSTLDGELFNGTSTEFSISNLSNGTHTVSLKVRDSHGVWSELVYDVLHVNGRPRACLDNVSASIITEGEEITFNGSGWDDEGVQGYLWYSSIDGILGENASHSFSNLSVGIHIISFSVVDAVGTWSKAKNVTVEVNGIPAAVIESIIPDHGYEGENITFTGGGIDDGSITYYSWRSSKDQWLYNGTNATFSSSNLSTGNHTIFLRVRDNHGIWSMEVLESLRIDIPILPEDLPPEIEITSPENGTVVKGVIKISGIASDDHAVEMVEYRIADSAEWAEADGITSWSIEIDTTVLKDGEHSVQFRGYDGTNYSAKVVITLIVKNEEDGNGGNGGDDKSDDESDSPFYKEKIGILPLIYYFVMAACILILSVGLKKKGKVTKEMKEKREKPEIPQETTAPDLMRQQTMTEKVYPQQFSQPQQYQQYAQTTNAPLPPSPVTPNGTWICPKCGNRVEGKFSFCTSCGFKRQN